MIALDQIYFRIIYLVIIENQMINAALSLIEKNSCIYRSSEMFKFLFNIYIEYFLQNITKSRSPLFCYFYIISYFILGLEQMQMDNFSSFAIYKHFNRFK